MALRAALAASFDKPPPAAPSGAVDLPLLIQEESIATFLRGASLPSLPSKGIGWFRENPEPHPGNLPQTLAAALLDSAGPTKIDSVLDGVVALLHQKVQGWTGQANAPAAKKTKRDGKKKKPGEEAGEGDGAVEVFYLHLLHALLDRARAEGLITRVLLPVLRCPHCVPRPVRRVASKLLVAEADEGCLADLEDLVCKGAMDTELAIALAEQGCTLGRWNELPVAVLAALPPLRGVWDAICGMFGTRPAEACALAAVMVPKGNTPDSKVCEMVVDALRRKGEVGRRGYQLLQTCVASKVVDGGEWWVPFSTAYTTLDQHAIHLIRPVWREVRVVPSPWRGILYEKALSHTNIGTRRLVALDVVQRGLCDEIITTALLSSAAEYALFSAHHELFNPLAVHLQTLVDAETMLDRFPENPSSIAPATLCVVLWGKEETLTTNVLHKLAGVVRCITALYPTWVEVWLLATIMETLLKHYRHHDQEHLDALLTLLDLLGRGGAKGGPVVARVESLLFRAGGSVLWHATPDYVISSCRTLTSDIPQGLVVEMPYQAMLPSNDIHSLLTDVLPTLVRLESREYADPPLLLVHECLVYKESAPFLPYAASIATFCVSKAVRVLDGPIAPPPPDFDLWASLLRLLFQEFPDEVEPQALRLREVVAGFLLTVRWEMPLPDQYSQALRVRGALLLARNVGGVPVTALDVVLPHLPSSTAPQGISWSLVLQQVERYRWESYPPGFNHPDHSTLLRAAPTNIATVLDRLDPSLDVLSEAQKKAVRREEARFWCALRPSCTLAPSTPRGVAVRCLRLRQHLLAGMDVAVDDIMDALFTVPDQDEEELQLVAESLRPCIPPCVLSQYEQGDRPLTYARMLLLGVMGECKRAEWVVPLARKIQELSSEAAMPNSTVHRSLVRGWQCLGVLCGVAVGGEGAEAIIKCFDMQNMVSTRKLAEVVCTGYAVRDPDLFLPHVLHRLLSFDLATRPQTLCSMVIIAGHVALAHREQQTPQVVHAILPYAMSSHFVLRLSAQLLMLRIREGVPREVLRFLDDSPDCAKWCEKYGDAVLLPPLTNKALFGTRRKEGESWVVESLLPLPVLASPVAPLVRSIMGCTTLADERRIRALCQEGGMSLAYSDDSQPCVVGGEEGEDDSGLSPEQGRGGHQTKIDTLSDMLVDDLQASPRELAERKAAAQPVVLVASLLHNNINVAALIRCSEVFAVREMAVANQKRLIADKSMGIAKSAQQWLSLVDVPPVDLVQYLEKKKSEGYTVVGVEQTSTSVPLQEYTFPQKTVLVLGAERTGITPEVIMHLDACIEIAQLGLIRSLNVHVCGAIVLHEYTRQRLIKKLLSTPS